jgi:hypothetical protein
MLYVLNDIILYSTADLNLHVADLSDFFPDGKSHFPIYHKTKSKVQMLLPRVHVDVFLCTGKERKANLIHFNTGA